jgi:3-oxoacyl-[acyl-carrier-protein] synthase II
MREGGLDGSAGGVDAERVGVIVGSGIGGIHTFEEQHARLLERGPDRVSPFFVPMFISDIAAGLVSIRFGARGRTTRRSRPAPRVRTRSATPSATSVRRADVMIAGGAEASVTPMTIAGFAAMKALSERNDEPETASRPFDADRDGFVMGEGAGIVVLEELEHARARGATIIAEVVGYGQTADAYHITGQPATGEGLRPRDAHGARATRRGADAVDYVNAHGTSTPLND